MSEAAFAGTRLSNTLQEQHSKFEGARDAYLETQQIYQAALKETNRLEQTAAALEAEAEQANSSWKAMALEPRADQRKINQEVDRSVQLKLDAEKFRRTASVREELHGALIIQMAKARTAVGASCIAVRGLYRTERIATLLATDGLAEVLRELRDLTGDDFTNVVASTANNALDVPSAIPAEILVPKAVPGEIVPSNGMEMARLEKSGGKTTSHTLHQ